MANQQARALRKRLTPQEVKLWVKLRELRPLGLRFRRQAPIGPYIVDFLCFHHRIVVEADGGQHNHLAGFAADQARDAFLSSQGFRVLRFWNSEIDRNLNGVLEAILSAGNDPHPAHGSAAKRPPNAGDPPHRAQQGLRLGEG